MAVKGLQKFRKIREKFLKKTLLPIMLIGAAAFCLGTALLDHLNVIDVDSWFYAAGLRPKAFTPAPGELTVHYLDVGQGDCQIILTEHQAVLIDGGEAENGIKVLSYLKSLGVESLDYAIITHPHSDHFGAVNSVLKGMEVKEVIMPSIPMSLVPNTALFKELLEILGEKTIAVQMAEDGMTVDLEGAALKILIPEGLSSKDLNDYSLTLRLVHGENSFLFTGDITKTVEYKLMDKGSGVIKSTVLKVAHHGSNTSSAENFLQAVDPDYAVIQSGAENSLDHPRIKVMKTLGGVTKNVYRTALDGNVIFYSKAGKLEVTAAKGRNF